MLAMAKDIEASYSLTRLIDFFVWLLFNFTTQGNGSATRAKVVIVPTPVWDFLMLGTPQAVVVCILMLFVYLFIRFTLTLDFKDCAGRGVRVHSINSP